MKHILPAIRSYLVLTILLGLIYPAVVTLLGQTAFSKESRGSLVEKNGNIVGSELIGQKFESDRYFWSRPSAIDYSPLPSGGTNLGPTSAALKETVVSRAAKLGSNPPKDLLFASGSGIDPHISPESAYYQLTRVAKARGVPEQDLRSMIDSLLEKRQLGFLGEERVNVLKLNLALEERK